MKKTLAFIASLVLMATAFVSCGDKDDDNSSSGRSSKSSSSVDKSDDDDDEDDNKSSKKDKDDDDDDDKKSSKKEKDDDDDKKSSKKDKDDDDEDVNDDDVKSSQKDDDDDKKPSNKSNGSIIGTWSLDEDSFEEMDFFMDINSVEYVFSDSEIEMFISCDVSDEIYIQGDSIIADDESVEYDYDGKVLTFQVNDEKIELTRVGSADKSSFYGRYSSDEEFFMGEVYFDFVDDGETYLVIGMKQEYTYDEKTGILTTIDEDGYEDEEQVEIDGDKMTVTNDIDGTMTFTRKK